MKSWTLANGSRCLVFEPRDPTRVPELQIKNFILPYTPEGFNYILYVQSLGTFLGVIAAQEMILSLSHIFFGKS